METAVATTLKSFVADRISRAAACYVGDLNAMTDEQLRTSPGGIARTPYDYTYEIIFINQRFATRMRGEEPPPFKMESWILAPDEYKNKELALKEFQASVDEVLSAWNAIAEDQLERQIPLADGSHTSPLDLAGICGSHITYHDAQLNYIQAMTGDPAMHWD